MAQVIDNDSNKAPLLLTPELIALYQSAGLKVPGKDKTISSIKNNIPKTCLKDEIKIGLRILKQMQFSVIKHITFQPIFLLSILKD